MVIAPLIESAPKTELTSDRSSSVVKKLTLSPVRNQSEEKANAWMGLSVLVQSFETKFPCSFMVVRMEFKTDLRASRWTW